MRQSLACVAKALGLAALTLGTHAALAQSLTITGEPSLHPPFVVTVDVAGLSPEQVQALEASPTDPDTLASRIKITLPQIAATPLALSAEQAALDPDLPLYAQFLALEQVGTPDAQGNATVEYMFQIEESAADFLAEHLTGSKQLQVMVGFLPPEGQLISAKATLAIGDDDALELFNHAQRPFHGVQCVAQNLRGRQFFARGRILVNVQNRAMKKCYKHSAQCRLLGCNPY